MVALLRDESVLPRSWGCRRYRKRLGLPGALRRGLGTTNIIESSFGGSKSRTYRVTKWQDGSMVKRWASSSLLAAEKSFRRIMGYRDLWMLKAALGEDVDKADEAA